MLNAIMSLRGVAGSCYTESEGLCGRADKELWYHSVVLLHVNVSIRPLRLPTLPIGFQSTIPPQPSVVDIIIFVYPSIYMDIAANIYSYLSIGIY
jgi:hypothetical protein